MIKSHAPGCTPGVGDASRRSWGGRTHGGPPPLGPRLLVAVGKGQWGRGHAPAARGRRRGRARRGRRQSRAGGEPCACEGAGPSSIWPCHTADVCAVEGTARSAILARGGRWRCAPAACCAAGGCRTTSRWRCERIQEAGGGRRGVGARIDGRTGAALPPLAPYSPSHSACAPLWSPLSARLPSTSIRAATRISTPTQMESTTPPTDYVAEWRDALTGAAPGATLPPPRSSVFRCPCWTASFCTIPTYLPPHFSLSLLVHFLYSCFCSPVYLSSFPPLPLRLSRSKFKDNYFIVFLCLSRFGERKTVGM
jgi:hypothetical protein